MHVNAKVLAMFILYSDMGLSAVQMMSWGMKVMSEDMIYERVAAA